MSELNVVLYEIDGGTDKATGEWVFFIEAVDEGEGRLTIWTGPNYDDAIKIAHHTAEGLPVVDVVVI